MCAGFSDSEIAQTLSAPWFSSVLKGQKPKQKSNCDDKREKQAKASGLGKNEKNPMKSQSNTHTQKSPERVHFRRLLAGLPYALPYPLGLPSLPGQFAVFVHFTTYPALSGRVRGQ